MRWAGFLYFDCPGYCIMAARRWHSGDTIVSPLVRRRPSIIVMSPFFCFVYFVLGIVYPPRDFAYYFIGFVLMSGVCLHWVLATTLHNIDVFVFLWFVYFVLEIVYPPWEFVYIFIGFLLMSSLPTWLCQGWIDVDLIVDVFYADIFITTSFSWISVYLASVGVKYCGFNDPLSVCWFDLFWWFAVCARLSVL